MIGGRTVAQNALFYSFNLERHAPADHMLRSIDRFVDLSALREHLRPYYSETGRPSIDPELLIQMLIIGYCMGIRSERRLCGESISIWPIAGFAGSASNETCPITRPSRRTAMAAFETAICCVSCSRRQWRAALLKGLSAVRVSRPTPA